VVEVRADKLGYKLLARMLGDYAGSKIHNPIARAYEPGVGVKLLWANNYSTVIARCC
jgi:hypothetical protein